MPVADIFHDAAGEEVDILKNDAEGAAQIVLADFFDVDAIVEDGAVVDVVKPIDEIGDGGFACPGGANESDFLSRFGVEGDVVEDLLGWCVTKIDVLETNIAAQATVLSDAILHTLPGPDASVVIALGEGTVCVFCDIDKDNAAVVDLVRFIHERKMRAAPASAVMMALSWLEICVTGMVKLRASVRKLAIMPTVIGPKPLRLRLVTPPMAMAAPTRATTMYWR